MKRDIICLGCNTRRVTSLGWPIVDTEQGPRLAQPVEPATSHRAVYGTAKRHLLCDICGDEIEVAQNCVAASEWRAGTEPFDWEDNYIVRHTVATVKR